MGPHALWLCISLAVASAAMIRLCFVADKRSATERTSDADLLVYAMFLCGIIVAHACMWELFGRAFQTWLDAAIPHPGTWTHDLSVWVVLAVSAIVATLLFLFAIVGLGISLKRMSSGRPGLQE